MNIIGMKCRNCDTKETSHLSCRNAWIVNSHKECWDTVTPPKLSGDTPIPEQQKTVTVT